MPARLAPVLLLLGIAAWLPVRAQAAGAAGLPRYLSAAGCGLPAGPPSRWHPSRGLEQAAALWARGRSLHAAIEASGYAASAVSGIHVDGIDARRSAAPSASVCRALRDPSMVEFGSFEQRDQAWMIFAAPIALPAAGDEARVARRALELVNRARRAPRQCGTRSLPPAVALRLSDRLSVAASEHALDMARRHYFEHRDPAGRTPADRVRAAGYADSRVGENIAHGALSTEDVVAGWLASPGHCENLMDPGFTEMGIAYAHEPGEHSALYWVQVLASPQGARRSAWFAPPAPNH